MVYYCTHQAPNYNLSVLSAQFPLNLIVCGNIFGGSWCVYSSIYGSIVICHGEKSLSAANEELTMRCKKGRSNHFLSSTFVLSSHFQRGVQCGVQRLEAMTSSDFPNPLEISASAY